ncbi:hypothetical protein [Wenyingzhuangia sp. 2_MG-2023]|uniref:hypothetical protein n=1 Tax=Wenyingzhuangia sp. 2_MG-2023 TaxID=3062639 RepID=UPI0026E1BC01|nr:hypothetical protein [Wenyingzhuangia sp. 2_MG-2023]MDO6736896.1 hypothetical protein [Wenyingzhuangia sp. 2_MG-2023]
MKKIILLPFAIILLFISCTNDESDDIFIPPTEPITEDNIPNECHIIEKDGLLIIEAENFNLKGNWRTIEDDKASGGKYIEYYGANSYNTPNLAHEISVSFKIDKASNYLVRWYMRQPDESEGDLANDVWIYFPENLGQAYINNSPYILEHYEKFVSRGQGEFTYGGALDIHEPKSSSWMRVNFPAAGEYTLKICARSQFFQLDKMVFSIGMTDVEAQEASKNLTETTTCD